MTAAGWIFMSVFWVMLVALVVWAAANLLERGERRLGRGDLDERPEEILDRRLASGEIDAANYESIRTTLRTGHAARA